MKKIALIVGGIIVILIAAVLVAPRVIDWNAFKPEIAAAVRDATGRDFHIDGNLDIKIIPGAAFSASGIRLANAPGADKPDMVRIKSIDGKIALLPLLSGTLVVERLVVREPEINLAVDKAGRPNWDMQPAKRAGQVPPPPPEKKAEENSGPPFEQIRLGDVRIEKGRFSYADAVTGQKVTARDLDVAIAMPALSQPLTTLIAMILNDESVTLNASVDTPQAVMSGRSASIKVALQSKRITLRLDGHAKQGAATGMDGALDLDIPSVGQLAAWLGRPLSQPDPGALKLHSEFDAAPNAVTVKTATIQGAGLKATASGAVQTAGGALRKLALRVDGGVLDVDRYLPKPAARPAGAAPRPAPQAARKPAPPGDLLAVLPNERFELKPLRDKDIDVHVKLQGVKAAGFQVGKIDVAAVMKNGLGAATIRELQLYGGRITGEAKLDASRDELGVDTTFAVDKVDVGRLAKAASAAEPPVAGIVTAKQTAAGRGNSPRALAQNLVGHLVADLSGADLRNAAAKISGLKLAVDLPGIDKAPTVKANAVYNGQPVTVDVTGDATRKMLSADRFQLTAAIRSALANVSYAGGILVRPTPGLDGTLDVAMGSVGRVMQWVGQPLAKGQPDPGPLKLHAVMAGDGGKATLKEARIEGKAIRATAKGSFDASKAVPEFDATVNVEQANLDAYLPPESKAAPKATSQRPQQRPAQPSGWSDAPIDTTFLSKAKGKIDASFKAIRYRGLTIDSGKAVASLADNAFKAALTDVKLAKGAIGASASVASAGKGLALDYQASVSDVEAQPLLVAFAGTDRLSGTLQLTAKGHATGASQKDLVASLNGDGAFKVLNGAIHGVNIASALRQAKTLGFDSSASASQKTDFAELSGSFTIRNGVLENKDLKMLAPLLRLAGEGQVPMPPRTVDYRVTATLVGSLKGQGGQEALAGLPIPIHVTGSWDAPSYNVDWKSVFLAAAKDPNRLKSMPQDLQNAAKGLGVALPGLSGSGSGKVQDILRAIPGLGGGASQPQQQPQSGTQQQPAQQPQQQPATPNPGQLLRGLFGQ